MSREELPSEQHRAFRDSDDSTINFLDAINFLNRLKTDLLTGKEDYKAFKHAILEYGKDDRNSLIPLIQEVSNLFNGDQDLLKEFRRLLPWIYKLVLAADMGKFRDAEEKAKISRNMLRSTNNYTDWYLVFIVLIPIIIFIGTWVNS